MIVCTAENTDETTNGNTDENNSHLNISVLENGEDENVICRKGNSKEVGDRKSTRLNSSHLTASRMPSSA